MNPERWRRIKELFADALDQPENARGAFLDQSCGSDCDLRREVDRLLAQAGATLRSPAAALLATPVLLPGEMLAHYRLEGKLGEGGMGSVYGAYDTSLERKVALKVLPTNPLAGAENRERLMSEARAASGLNHPNIVTVYEVGSGGGVDYIAMEYVDGCSLSHIIPPAGLPLQRALVLAAEIAGALEQAHAAGVVHRDLKPANIMVTPSGHTKLLDFGLAQRVLLVGGETSQARLPGEVAGTPAYMSPEQTDGQRADQRSDVFSFGVVLFEMLTGRRPFAGSSATTVMASVLRDDAPPLKGVPVKLAKMVHRCLQKDPGRRFQKIGEVRTLLEDLVQQGGGRRGAGQGLRIASGTLAVALLMTTAFALFYPPKSRQSRETASKPEPARQVAASGATTTAKEPTPVTPPSAPPAIQNQESQPPLWEPPAPATGRMRVVPIAAYSGMVRDPSFSPNGDQVAFSWEGSGAQSIYVKPLLSEAPPARLTMGPDEGAAWSPHGTRIAFRRTGGTSSGIYMAPPSGGREERVTFSSPLGNETLPQMSWTPDGNWLAAPERSADGSTQILLHSVHGAGSQQLTRNAGSIDHAPAISPNGAFLAYASCTVVYSCDVYLSALDRHYAATGRSAIRLTDDAGYVRGVSWMPDSKSVVYAAGQKANAEIHLWRVAISPPGLPERLDVAGTQVRHPTVFRKGGLLAFTRFNYDADIWRYEMGAKPAPFLSAPVFEYDPAFSPDGRKIAYCSRASGTDEIWTCNRDGSTRSQVTNAFHRGASSPAWSPDGRSIAFESLGDDGHNSIYLVQAAGGLPRRVTSPAYDAVAPAWSRDGKSIYFGLRHGVSLDIWRIPAAGGDITRITDRGGLYSAESLDGKMLYYTKPLDPAQPTSRSPLYVRSLAGGPERKLIDDVDWYGFSVAPAGIYYLTANGKGSSALKLHDLGSGQSRIVSALRAAPFHRMTVSPDGQTVLFGTLRGLDWSLLLIEGF